MFDKLGDRARDALFLNPSVWFDGNREMTIENCRRIEEYNEVFIQLAAGKLRICIWGSGLRAFDYKTGGLVIRGHISQVEFIERSGRDNEKPASGVR